jgi:zinc/manganese transport system substrate-binding protein
MTKKLLIAIPFLFVSLHAADARADLDVVTTVPDLAALAKAVGGDKVEVTSLALHTQDPHFVDAKPSLALDLNKADMLVAVGFDLEVGWLPALQSGARNSDILASGDGYLECSSYIVATDRATTVDRADGDIHPGGNPHYLYAPKNALACAAGIAARMGKLDPDNKDHYYSGYARLAKRIKAKVIDWESRMAEHAGAKIVTFHRSWIYMTNWLDLDVVAHIEDKPGVSPTPRHIARVIKKAKADDVRVILHEAYYPSKTGKLVAKKAGAQLVELPGAADFAGGESYIERMEALISALEAALAGNS